MNKQELFSRLISYYMSQNHERDNLIEDLLFSYGKDKGQLKQAYKDSMVYACDVVRSGKREANKIMHEVINEALQNRE